MGLNPLNFSDAFLCVLAQRLVRRLCNACKEKYHPDRAEFEDIVNDYGREAFETLKIADYSKDLFLYRARGCEQCSGSGYRGRIGVHELMDGTAAIKKLIKKQAPSDELFKQAASEGMTTLRQDGIQKVFQGLTDISEIRRVCIN
jgi:type II secretory ATPase GspE/PulE/Tfp pilus assembly ATPase PilB-like protein